MTKPQVIFENEEAEKLLDYFVAYRKLNETADYLRCVSKVNSEIIFSEIAQPAENLPPFIENQP